MHEGPPAHRPSPAPRAISTELTVRALFGGVLSQLGWFFVLFGMLFVWAFDAGSGLAEWIRFRGDLERVEGTATGWRETNLSINDTRVYETFYTFRLPDGASAQGSSYDTGSWLDKGRSVTIEYPAGDPTHARIRGMRASEGGIGVAFVFVFPLVGLFLTSFGVRRGLKARRLMALGTLTRGTLKSTEATNTTINNQRVMRLTFEFEAGTGQTFEAVAKTHRPERLQDEERERIVYDPQDPSVASVLDELPCQPRVGEGGGFEASRPGLPTPLYLLLPGMAALAIVRYFLSIF